jgi:hypothetical protein
VQRAKDFFFFFSLLDFFLLTPHVKMEQTQCSETSAHKIQTPGNHLKERRHFILFSDVSTLALGHT